MPLSARRADCARSLDGDRAQQAFDRLLAMFAFETVVRQVLLARMLALTHGGSLSSAAREPEDLRVLVNGGGSPGRSSSTFISGP